MNERVAHGKFQCAEGAKLVVRPAQPEDAMDVLRWRNDPVVCAMSRQNEAVSEAVHMAWYSRALDDPSRLLLVGFLAGKRVGIVRFDLQESSLWEVSVTISPEARGMGLGREVLGLALKYLYAVFPAASVLAVAKVNNDPSLRLFHALGFSRESDDGVFARLVLYPDARKPSP